MSNISRSPNSRMVNAINSKYLATIGFMIIVTAAVVFAFIPKVIEKKAAIRNFVESAGDKDHLTTLIDGQATCYWRQRNNNEDALDSNEPWNEVVVIPSLIVVLLLLRGIVDGVELGVRNGTFCRSSALAITTAAGKLNQANRTARIDQFQKDLNCCGFVLKKLTKSYTVCVDDLAPNCSTAFDDTFWPIQLTIALLIVNVAVAVGITIIALYLLRRNRRSRIRDDNLLDAIELSDFPPSRDELPTNGVALENN